MRLGSQVSYEYTMLTDSSDGHADSSKTLNVRLSGDEASGVLQDVLCRFDSVEHKDYFPAQYEVAGFSVLHEPNLLPKSTVREFLDRIAWLVCCGCCQGSFSGSRRARIRSPGRLLEPAVFRLVPKNSYVAYSTFQSERAVASLLCLYPCSA